MIRRWLLPAVAVAAGALALLASGVAEPPRRAAADFAVRASLVLPPPVPTGVPDVAVIAIDPQSLRARPRWPWPRELYAELLERLEDYGVRAVGFDIDFSTPRDAQDDARFAAEIAESGRVVLAVFRQLQSVAGGAELEIASLPIEGLASRSAGFGSVLVPVDPDGAVRHVPASSRIGGQRFPSLAAATLAVAMREPPSPPLAGEPLVRVDYRRARPPVPVLSFVDVLEGRVDPRVLSGRAVLVGATAAEFQDLWTTPLGHAVPGVMIQALALRTLAAERVGAPTLARPPLSAELAWLLVFSLTGAALGLVSHGARIAGLLGLAAFAVGSSLAAAAASGWLLDPVLPVGVLATHYVLGLESVRRRFGRSLEEREHSLSALFRVGQATVASPSGAGGLDVALALVGDVVEASAVSFLRATPEGELDGRRLDWTRTPGGALADAVIAQSVLDAGRARTFEGWIPGRPGRRGTAVYLPLRAGGMSVGVLAVERDTPAALDSTQLRTIGTVAAQLALSAQNLSLLEDLRTTFDASVAAIATAIEARDGYTELHCRRLAAFSAAMARRLGLEEEEVEAIRLGALLHDVGKIGIPDRVLMKPGAFDAEERRLMQRHTEIGHQIVSHIHGISPLTVACVRNHHERWDGEGYPDGFAGEEIPLPARVVTVVDVWDALCTERPYKKSLPPRTVRMLLEKERGTRFDPELLSLFFRVMDEEGEEVLLALDPLDPT